MAAHSIAFDLMTLLDAPGVRARPRSKSTETLLRNSRQRLTFGRSCLTRNTDIRSGCIAASQPRKSVPSLGRAFKERCSGNFSF